MDKLQIYIGYDTREVAAYYTLASSILKNTDSKKIIIQPLKLQTLTPDFYYRTDSKGTTEFSLTRFLVPYLSAFGGYSVFMDCDMLCKIDILELKSIIDQDPDQAVYVCKHNYQSQISIKATGVNENYPRKNWSSLMIFNNEKCTNLTLDYVNTASASDLHRLNWADEKIGSIPLEYNWLVGEYPHNDDAKILHYTLGTPCFEEYKDCDHSKEWHEENKNMIFC